MCEIKKRVMLFVFLDGCFIIELVMRKEFCEKDGILITYTENDVCFEDCKTAEAILLKNDGSIIHSNFDEEKNVYFQEYLKRISPVIKRFRIIDSL